ncbi:MAG TPA: glycoside hydrolase family 3 N-terminal domain-containing protein [Mycobacteriales bacterium]|jgi:beta-N-acetylhexosaminidase|nr:glycoside hydrolase family 3 N-terminal domain-containing protein [Mycobacteriales bacterium]
MSTLSQPPRRRTTALTTVLALAGLVAMSAAAPAISASPRSPATSPKKLAAAAYARMTPAQRVGQLFMPGVTSTGPTSAEAADVVSTHSGNVFLRGDSTAGLAAERAVVRKLVPKATHAKVLPFVGTDQEGGEVQVLQGSGYTRMPTALAQGRLTTATLRTRAAGWGAQLLDTGVNVDLAPVADTVPASIGTANQPIGRYDREFGHTIARVAGHVTAFVQGMTKAKVATTVKHFPGLGRATGNTDIKRGVTDPTGPHSKYLTPYRDGIVAGAQFVMVSSAKYPKIDKWHRACFSKPVIGTLLRGQEKFTGIVISDSFNAVAVSDLSPAQRALRFFGAGGTILLDTLPSDIRPMTKAVLAQQASDSHFAGLIKAAVMLVLTTKARDGLIS